MAVNIGPKIGIDGEAQYRQEINAIIQQAKTLDAEMKSVASSFTSESSASQKATATSKVLNQQIQVQQQRISLLSSMLEKSAAKYGENDTKTLKWKQAVLEATTQLNKMQSEVNQAGNATDDLGSAMTDAGSKALSFGDILKASVLSQAIVDGVKAIASAVKDMAVTFVQNAADVKAEASQFSQTFGEFSTQAQEAIGRVADSSGILDTRLNTLGSQIYAFARSSGGSAEESMSLMEQALQASADSAAYYDKSLEETTDTLQSFLKGNYENDAALGISATETTRNSAAMEQFGKKFQDLTEIQKQQTLLKMVVDGQKLSGAFGQAARESDGFENVMGNLNESWRQFTAAIGTPILNAVIPIIQNITSAISNLNGQLDTSSFTTLITSLVASIGNMAPQIATVAVGMAQSLASGILNAVPQIAAGFNAVLPQMMQTGTMLLQNLANGIMTALPLITTAVQSIISSFTSYIGANLPQLLSAGLQFLMGFSESLRANASTLVDSALNLVQTLAQGLIASLPVIIQTVPTIVSNIAGIINDNAPKLLATAAVLIGQLAVGLVQNIPVLVANLPQILMAIANVITAFNWINLGGTIVKGLANGIKSLVGTIKSAADGTVKELVANLKSGFAQLPKMALDWGKDMITGFIDGITGSIGGIVDAVSGVASTVSSFLHFSRPDVGPLREYETWMPDMMAGMAKGIAQNAWMLEDALNAATSHLQGNINITNTAAPAVAGGGSPIQIIINPSPGMDINALADAVAFRLQTLANQREAMW